MGNDASKVEEIVELIKNDDFCSFASQIAENEAIIKDSDDYGRTLLWVSWMEKIQDLYMYSQNWLLDSISEARFYEKKITF